MILKPKRLLINSAVCTIFPLTFIGCTTSALFEKTEVVRNYSKEVILNDTVIAIGRPSQQIPNFPNALILAGKKQSYLVQPAKDGKTSQHLFLDIYENLDLNHIYLDPTNQIFNKMADRDRITQENMLRFDLGQDPKSNSELKSSLGIYYLKSMKKVSSAEKQKLAQLNFDCKTVKYEKENSYFCARSINTVVQVASQVQNLHAIQHQLKQPLNIEVSYTKVSSNYSKWAFRALTPVTIAVDIVTSPIQIPFLFIQGLAMAWAP